jgi:amino-acid N-acetyltransferase
MDRLEYSTDRDALLVIRAGRAQDAASIRGLVLRARLNPVNLQWRRFVVAEDCRTGALAGIGQVRVHGDGAQELASIVVAPGYRHRGIGRAIVRTLMSRTEGALFLFCRAEMGSYYARLGFEEVDIPQLPGSLARMLHVARLYTGLAKRLGFAPARVIAMRRAPVA